MEPARKNSWINSPSWTIYDLVFLLRGWEPRRPLDVEASVIEEFKQEMREWERWSPSCPGMNRLEQMPLKIPVDTKTLLKWANSLAGITLPEWMLPLIEPNEEERSTDDQEAEDWLTYLGSTAKTALGDKERQSLLTTIGSLASTLVEKTGDATGTPDKPNVKGIAEMCKKSVGPIHGQSSASVRKRISQGLALVEEKKTMPTGTT